MLQSAIIPDVRVFTDFQQGKEVDLHVLVFPDWEPDFAAGKEILVFLISNGIDRPFSLGTILKNYGKVPSAPEGQPYALKLKVKRIQ